jgi:Fic family protein
MRLKELLMKERESGYGGGLYHETQILLAFHSNHIEGNSLTEEQTRFMYDTKTYLAAEGRFDNVSDITEMNNHFVLFNYMICGVDGILTEGLIKDYHRILRSGTSDVEMNYAIGEYKSRANAVGNVITAEPEAVREEMEGLLIGYNAIREKKLEDIVLFHVRYETIHPFQEGNGRTGRMIMFKECLKNGILPFIIDDGSKSGYYNGLREYWRDASVLENYIREKQSEYRRLAGKYASAEIEELAG